MHGKKKIEENASKTISLLGFNQIAPAGTVKAWQREMSFKYVRARAWDGSIVR